MEEEKVKLQHEVWDHYPSKEYKTILFWRQREGEHSTYAAVEVYFRPDNRLIVSEVFTSKSAARKHLERITLAMKYLMT